MVLSVIIEYDKMCVCGAYTYNGISCIFEHPYNWIHVMLYYCTEIPKRLK